MHYYRIQLQQRAVKHNAIDYPVGQCPQDTVEYGYWHPIAEAGARWVQKHGMEDDDKEKIGFVFVIHHPKNTLDVLAKSGIAIDDPAIEELTKDDFYTLLGKWTPPLDVYDPTKKEPMTKEKAAEIKNWMANYAD